MIIEVFKTNISHPGAALAVISSLLQVWPQWKINVDLHDCDNILRIESLDDVDPSWVSSHLSRIGYMAEVLE